MENIKQKYSICPVCGNKLVEISANNGTLLYYLCTDSSCRTMIKESTISTMDIEIYSRVQTGFNIQQDKSKCDGYMLLNEKLSAPLMLKNNNSIYEKCKNLYCIVRAESIDDAIEQLQRKFEYIKITSERVVPINIKEL